MNKTICVVEHERKSKQDLTEQNFNQLKEMCLQDEYKDIFSYQNGKICFKNYAGVLELKSGDFIEVLPKICFSENKQDECRTIFRNMIATLKSNYYKAFDNTNINCGKFPLMEIFITVFLNELDDLIRLGVRKNYVKVSENSNFIKGKIKILNNIKYNSTHKERNYIEYSKFIENIPENIILKTCLLYLQNKTTDIYNKKRINEALFVFDEIRVTYNIANEFNKICLNRLNIYYETPLELAQIFLMGNSFLPQTGKTNLLSLMFPLEKLFEEYVFFNLKKEYKDKFQTIKAQSNPYYLIESENKFKLKPDIVMENDKTIIILDTKWKLLDLNSNDGKYNISQSDLYQLYAYGKKYKQKQIEKGSNKKIQLFLIYPMTEKFNITKTWNYEKDESLPINIVPYDLKSKNLLYKL